MKSSLKTALDSVKAGIVLNTERHNRAQVLFSMIRNSTEEALHTDSMKAIAAELSELASESIQTSHENLSRLYSITSDLSKIIELQ